MNKKWILAGMAALTAMSVLAGCGTQPDKTPTKTNKPLIVGTDYCRDGTVIPAF